MFGTIIQNQATTLYRIEAAAKAMVDTLNADDDTCTYAVEPRPNGFVVVVRDAADGLLLGTL